MRWRLAISLGYPHPDFLLRQLTSSQLTELEAFRELEGGFGEFKQDHRFAQLCALLANIHRDTKKHPEAYTMRDFLLIPQDEESQREKNKRIRGMFDMLSKRKGKKKK